MASNANTDAKETPKTFQLTINYRSHGGIVGCAHSVVKLITEFWPHAIDILAEERGIIDGLKPVFFSGWDQDTVRYEQFLFGASWVQNHFHTLLCTKHYRRGSQIEFGAQQCERIACNMRIPLKYEKGILVRDDVARDKLRGQVGEIGLIL